MNNALRWGGLAVLFVTLKAAAQLTQTAAFQPVPELGYRVVPDFFHAIRRIVVRVLTRGEPVALGRVGARVASRSPRGPCPGACPIDSPSQRYRRTCCARCRLGCRRVSRESGRPWVGLISGAVVEAAGRCRFVTGYFDWLGVLIL
jgi:hypothetical protein